MSRWLITLKVTMRRNMYFIFEYWHYKFSSTDSFQLFSTLITCKPNSYGFELMTEQKFNLILNINNKKTQCINTMWRRVMHCGGICLLFIWTDKCYHSMGLKPKLNTTIPAQILNAIFLTWNKLALSIV